MVLCVLNLNNHVCKITVQYRLLIISHTSGIFLCGATHFSPWLKAQLCVGKGTATSVVSKGSATCGYRCSHMLVKDM